MKNILLIVLFFLSVNLFGQNLINPQTNPLFSFNTLYNDNNCYFENISDTITQVNYKLIGVEGLVFITFGYSSAGCYAIEITSSKLYHNGQEYGTGFYYNNLIVGDEYIWTITFRINPGCNIDFICPIYFIENPLSVELKSFKVIEGNLIEFEVFNQINNRVFIVEQTNDFKVYRIVKIVDGDGTLNAEKTFSVVDTSFNNEVNYYILTSEDYNGVKDQMGVTYIDNTDLKRTKEYKDIMGREIIDLNEYSGIYFEVLNKNIYITKYKYK